MEKDNIPIKGMAKRVYDVLAATTSNGEIKYYKARDNDSFLLMVVWTHKLRELGYDPENMGSWELLGMLGRGELPNMVSVWRCRQKLQEENESLRGDKYNDRHSHAPGVKEELKEKDLWTGKLF